MIVLIPEHGPRVTIVDAHPERYEFGVATIHLVELPDSEKASVGQLIEKGWLVPQDGSVTYGYFTFFQRNERFVGYATPDFRRFCLQMTFERLVRLYLPVVRRTER